MNANIEIGEVNNDGFPDIIESDSGTLKRTTQMYHFVFTILERKGVNKIVLQVL
jgi:hypothetical protein